MFRTVSEKLEFFSLQPHGQEAEWESSNLKVNEPDSILNGTIQSQSNL